VKEGGRSREEGGKKKVRKVESISIKYIQRPEKLSRKTRQGVNISVAQNMEKYHFRTGHGRGIWSSDQYILYVESCFGCSSL
jgi:hypothetical protein